MNSKLFELNLNIVESRTDFVPNEFASVNGKTRIAFIGDCPGEADLKESRPFVGTSGGVLKNLIAGAGVSPMASFFGNVSRVPLKYKPPAFPYNHDNVLAGASQLKADLDKFQPNLVVLLGDGPLGLAGKRGESPSNWHGSIFKCEALDSPFYGFKCISTFCPKRVLQVYEWLPLMRLNLNRAAEEGEYPELRLPQRTYGVTLSPYEILERLKAWPAGQPMALDIEGYVEWISCLSIASSPTDAFIIPFGVHSIEDDIRLIEQLRITMARSDIPKILQNCIYDYFALVYRYQIHLSNIVVDTMLSGWEIYPELPKGLGTQTAIWTKEPYYKFQRKIDDATTHWKYCCTDACVTYEIAEKHLNAFTPAARGHFTFNMKLLPAINYMMLRGMRFDKSRADELMQASRIRQDEIQLRINVECGRKVNVNSPKQMSTILYVEKGFPRQHPKVAGRIDKTKLTTNIDALLELGKHYDAQLIRDLIAWRKCEKMQQTLAIPVSPKDGRVRCSYNVVGTETGRLNCQASAEPSETLGPDGKLKRVGANLTTITKKLRHLFLADEGYEIFQCDLAGADGWTVAAHCKALGDPTMMDDYLFGLKPAQIIAYMFVNGAEITKLSRDELRPLLRGFGGDNDTAEHRMLYFTCKRVQHGTNYLLGPDTMAGQILKDSFKLTGNPIYVEKKTCIALQQLYNLRYKGVAAWQQWVKQELQSKGRLGAASGHVRTFFGRRQAHETLRTAVAHEPQANTTYATNLALYNLWHDPENRNPDGSLIIQLLHHVHDAMIGQWPVAQRNWAISKIRTYFDNTLTIARQPIRIPFEGNYGRSWGEQPNSFDT